MIATARPPHHRFPEGEGIGFGRLAVVRNLSGSVADPARLAVLSAGAMAAVAYLEYVAHFSSPPFVLGDRVAFLGRLHLRSLTSWWQAVCQQISGSDEITLLLKWVYLGHAGIHS